MASTGMTAKNVEDALRLRRQIVLVVDDEQDIRESLKDVLEAYLDNVEVQLAASGPDGLSAMRRASPDLVISDYKMPGMNGLEFLAEARKIAPNIPRVMITAFPDMDLAIRSINQARIENFFTKPLDRQLVIEVCRSHLYEQRAVELRSRAFARSLEVLRQRIEGR